MWQATRKAAELIKLVTYCNNMNAYCANLRCTHPHTHNDKKTQNSRIVQKDAEKPTSSSSFTSSVCQKGSDLGRSYFAFSLPPLRGR